MCYYRIMSTPTLAIEPPRLGTVVYWAIEQIITRRSTDSVFYVSWDAMLESKRQDSHYPDVVESLRQDGFIRPLTADVRAHELRLSDGHHRIAAAIDLGMEAVPVLITGTPLISEDSGSWQLGYSVDPEVELPYWYDEEEYR